MSENDQETKMSLPKLGKNHTEQQQQQKKKNHTEQQSGPVRIPVHEGLVLSTPEERDAEEMYDVVDANRKHLETYLPWVKATNSSQDTLAWIKTVRAGYVEGKDLHLCMRLRGRIIGVIGFKEIQSSKKRGLSGELGYWMSSDAQGRGHMSNAVRALIQFAFETLQLDSLFAKVDQRNRKSMAVLRRLGMRLVEGLECSECCGGQWGNEVKWVSCLITSQEWASAVNKSRPDGSPSPEKNDSDPREMCCDLQKKQPQGSCCGVKQCSSAQSNTSCCDVETGSGRGGSPAQTSRCDGDAESDKTSCCE